MPIGKLHMLSGVSGWGFPASGKGSTTMIVKLHFANGESEEHKLINGEHFADYIRRIDVPVRSLRTTCVVNKFATW